MSHSELAHLTIFISYTHDSVTHKRRVLDLSERLRADGIDSTIDQYESSPREGWPLWMTKKIQDADFVLVVCTRTYHRRILGNESKGKGLGSRWEGKLIVQRLYEAAENSRVLPIVFSDEDTRYIPLFLRDSTYFNLGTAEGYELLIHHLKTQLSYQEKKLELPESPRSGRSVTLAAPWNVPLPRNTFFTGRGSILRKLRNAFTNPSDMRSHITVLSGLGGMGKTQTAVEYAYRHRDDYSAIFWVNSDTQELIAADYKGIAQLLHLPFKDNDDPNATVPSVRRWLENNTSWLLIYDNADEPDVIQDFMPNESHGHILLTSRAQVFDNLGATTLIELDKMSSREASSFYKNRTRRPNLTSDESNAVKELSKELDYLPLALEQSAAYITRKKCSFRAYLESYKRRGLDLLQRSRAVTGRYPHSVATTWSLNFESVGAASSASADLLRFCAFLGPDKIPLDLIVLAAPHLGSVLSTMLEDLRDDELVLNELLEPLANYSLIQQDPGARSFNIHRLVQTVLREGLSEDAQREWAIRTVHALNHAFPKVEFMQWGLSERLLPHVLVCADLIAEMQLELKEAADLLANVGRYLHKQAKDKEAERLHKQALAIRRKALGNDHSDVASSLKNLADVYSALRRYSDSERLHLEALRIREKVYGPEHADIAHSLNNLALVYRMMGNHQEAERLHLRALAIRKKVHGEEHQYVGNSLSNLAALYASQENYARAEQLYRQALSIREKALGNDHVDVAHTLGLLANLCFMKGDYSSAERFFSRALQIRERNFQPRHPQIANTLSRLAAVYVKEDRYEEAVPLYRRAISIYERSPSSTKTLVKVLEQYIVVLEKTGRMSEAAEMKVVAETLQEKPRAKGK
jgi:tetratricopeptide (TPR) repeat protein